MSDHLLVGFRGVTLTTYRSSSSRLTRLSIHPKQSASRTMLTVSSGPIALTLDVNWRLLALTAAIACVATISFGVFPALRLARRDIVPMMKSASAGAAGAPPLRPATVLMAIQVAVSIPLVVGAAIFLQTVHNLGRVDLGFNPDRLVSFRIDPSLSSYERAHVEQIYERVLERLRDTPGVSSATLVGDPLLAGTYSNTSATLADGSKRDIYFNRIGPNYFTTMGIPLIAGRVINARDRNESPHVIVINEAAAAAFFGNRSPLGQRMTIFGADTEVVGVVRDTKYDSVRYRTAPTMFLPFLQTSAPLTLGAMHVVVRTTVPPGVVTGALRAVVADVDRDVPVSRMKTQTDQIEETLGTELAFTRLLLAFAAFALFLACIGLHVRRRGRRSVRARPSTRKSAADYGPRNRVFRPRPRSRRQSRRSRPRVSGSMRLVRRPSRHRAIVRAAAR